MGFCVRVVYQNGRGEVKAEFDRCRGVVKHESAKERSSGMLKSACQAYSPPVEWSSARAGFHGGRRDEANMKTVIMVI